MMLDEGKKAPDFKLPKDGGETLHLASRKGRYVVLFFYPKDDTSGCTKEAIAFTSLASEFDSLGCRHRWLVTRQRGKSRQVQGQARFNRRPRR